MGTSIIAWIRTRCKGGAFLNALCTNGAVINTAVVMATADGIIQNHDSSSLVKNGGSIVIIKHWASSIMTWIKYVKRHKAKVTVANFDVLKKQFISDVQAISEFEEILDELILRFILGFITFITALC